MEKRRPTFDLEAFKSVCGDPERINMTTTAALSARSMGYTTSDICDVVRSMTRRMFFKSMTSYADHTRWQDVYHVPGREGEMLYVKFTDDLISEFVLLSFKEK